jgi:DNA-directed RNA polymerase specialized sigma24 family protein
MIEYSPLMDRPHPGRPTVPLKLSPDERERVEAAVRTPKTEQRVAHRAQALLMLADAVTASDIAKLLGVHERTVQRWRARFECAKPSEKLADAPRSGRPRALSRKPTARSL